MLHQTLAVLEAQFAAMVIEEFQDHHTSIYLARKIAQQYDANPSDDAPTAQLETLEKDIVTLRVRLGESLSEGPVAVVQDYITTKHAALRSHPRGLDRARQATRVRLQQMLAPNPPAASGT